jgi:Tol biopolymer transport system component
VNLSAKAVRSFVFSALFLLACCGAIPSAFAQTITVTSANPNSAGQGTVNLNVTVSGSGFKKGAAAKWFVTGTTNPGGVTVNSTAFNSSSQLTANITVAADATIAQFDILVANINGRTGKGTELFAVTAPDPAIAFTGSYTNNNSNLMAVNADGSDMITVLSQAQDGLGHNGPAWSPDGARLAFGGFNPKTNRSAIYVVNKNGTGLTKVVGYNYTNSYAWKIAWSPVPLADGQYKIAFSDRARLPNGTLAPQSDIFIVNLDGTGLTQLTNTSSLNEWDVCWSPTADRIAVQAYNYAVNNGLAELDVYSVTYGTGAFTATFLTNLMGVPGSPLTGDFGDPAWAKTQDKIAVAAAVPAGTGYYKIWVIDLADPANPTDITPFPNTFNQSPTWAPDDSKIAYLGNYLSGPYSIRTINSDGSGSAQQLDAPQQTFSYNRLDWRRCCPACSIGCSP